MNLFLNSSVSVQIGIIIISILVVGLTIISVEKTFQYILEKLFTEKWKLFYREVIKPDTKFIVLLMLLGTGDLTLIFNEVPKLVSILELFLSLFIAVLVISLTTKWFKILFDNYLLNAALQSQKKINSEFLIVGKFLANSIIVVIVIFIFSQVHKINLFGLLASVGIGGLAIAFAAQKTLEQLLGGIVIYLDKPFSLDDYIGLPKSMFNDEIFGKVESIGLRSTKIRVSGKGTLMVVPNSSLTQVSIENFTGAKKIISLVYLTFYTPLEEDERALIRQIILDSTKDIFGIDPKNTTVKFEEVNEGKNKALTQAQISFFLLGSEQVSMDLRRQLLEIANQNISIQLKNYGIDFKIEDETINVDSPITI